jgi:hypothetical protein
MREFFTYGSVRGAARKGRSLPRLRRGECQVSRVERIEIISVCKTQNAIQGLYTSRLST